MNEVHWIGGGQATEEQMHFFLDTAPKISSYNVVSLYINYCNRLGLTYILPISLVYINIIGISFHEV